MLLTRIRQEMVLPFNNGAILLIVDQYKIHWPEPLTVTFCDFKPGYRCLDGSRNQGGFSWLFLLLVLIM